MKQLVTIPINPHSKPRMTQRDKWKKRPVVVSYRKFCDDLRLLWGNREVNSSFKIMFHIPMPQSWSKKKRAEMNNKPHQKKPDIDNLVKAFLDALCTDDSYVYHVNAVKYWSDEGKIIVKQIK